jgi:hypothetical protein
VSVTDWGWFALAIALIIAVGVACWVLAKLSVVLTSVRDLVDGVAKETVPLIGDMGDTVKLVNHELTRVDGILASAEQVAQTTGHVVTVVSETVTSPLVKLSAFAWGLRKAVGADGEEDGAPRRGRGRARRWRRRR